LKTICLSPVGVTQGGKFAFFDAFYVETVLSTITIASDKGVFCPSDEAVRSQNTSQPCHSSVKNSSRVRQI